MKTMTTIELKDKIVAANKAYRAGTPIMEDGEFDELVDSYQKLVSESEFAVFRDSLHEVKGKVKHPYILGSLDKLKAEEPKDVLKFLQKNIKTKLNVSAKIDGISCRCHYENGKLVSASTRGNGSFGEDLSDKIVHVKSVCKSISVKSPIDIRGELVILKDDFEDFSGEFANPRNAVAGIMNRKDWNKDDIAKVSFVCYTILGDKYTKAEQFKLLKNCGFVVAENQELDGPFDEKTIERLMTIAQKNHDYETDGLVLCDSEYRNEEKYRPDTCRAFKINQQIATTRIVDVAFDGPSPNGTHCPVAILDPVELGGATISRATLHNLDIIENLGLKYGSIVKLLRSGDVIPKIVALVDNPEGCSEIILPKVCNCCGSELVRDGVNLRCMNKDCKEQKLEQLTSFVKKLGVKGSAKKLLEKFGILTFDDLLKFVPDKTKKSEVKLYEELQMKIFSRSKQDLLAAMNFNGLAETSINKIVDFYGFDKILAREYVGFPDGVGETTLQKFKDDILENLEIVNKFICDGRYNYSGNDSVTVGSNQNNKNGMSVCFTGKLNTMGRTEAEKKAVAAGFEVKAVNKKLTYLVTNDPDTNSGKGKKARELGIKIISEAEFLKMLNENTLAQDIDAL